VVSETKESKDGNRGEELTAMREERREKRGGPKRVDE